jgi:hypothetical protein
MSASENLCDESFEFVDSISFDNTKTPDEKPRATTIKQLKSPPRDRLPDYTKAAILREVLTVADNTAITFADIAKRKPAEFGRQGSKLREKVRQHYNYIIRIREKDPSAFSRLCKRYQSFDIFGASPFETEEQTPPESINCPTVLFHSTESSIIESGPHSPSSYISCEPTIAVSPISPSKDNYSTDTTMAGKYIAI